MMWQNTSTAKEAGIKTWNYFLDLLFPKECVACGKEGTWLCKKCASQTIEIKTFYCPNCKTITPNNQFCKNCRKKYALTGIIIAAHYRHGPLREAIHEYKYEGIKELEKYLSSLIIKRLKNHLPRGQKIIVPIPLHKKREAGRGFNQAERLAQIVSREFDLPLDCHLLERIKETKSQMKLKKKKRRQNIKGAFQLVSNKNIKDKTILLIDDIATTGLTLNEAALVLREGGAREVWGVVVAQG